MWDAHCHLDDPILYHDLTSVMERARVAGVDGMVSAGVSPQRWRDQSDMARRYPAIAVTYGLHPWFVAETSRSQAERMLEQLAAALDSDEFVAPVGLGEMGLDRSQRVPADSLPVQRFVFREQLAMARERALPVVLHVVRAHGMMLDILQQDGVPEAGGLVHGFSGSPEVAQAYYRLGLHVSFGGMITRERAKKARKAAAAVPDTWLLCETDAPDMPPAAMEGKPNEPGFLPLIVEALAAIRGVSVAHITSVIHDNTVQLFGL